MSEDNFTRKLEKVIKPWVLVLLFILGLLFLFAKESKADEVTAELGATILSGQFSGGAALLIEQTWNDRWRIGMGLTSDQKVTPRTEPETNVRSNLMVHGQRLVGTERFKLGIGVAYWNAKTRWNGSNFTASMSIEYDFTDKWGVRYRHFSNAGSASPNMGQDMITFGYRF